MALEDPLAWRLETDLMLIESYRPSADHAAFLDLFGGRSREGLRVMAEAAPGVRFVGAIVVPGDEQVFYLVAARSMGEVQRLIEAAGLDTIRIVPAAWASPMAR